jgi:hypothetical protein
MFYYYYDHDDDDDDDDIAAVAIFRGRAAYLYLGANDRRWREFLGGPGACHREHI